MFKVLNGSTHIPEGMGNQFLVFRVVLDNDMYDAMLAIGFGSNRIALNTKKWFVHMGRMEICYISIIQRAYFYTLVVIRLS